MQLKGYVINTSEEGIENALVESLETGQRTYTDAEGKYSLVDIPEQVFTIRVIATGFRAKRLVLDMKERQKSDNQEYKITLFLLSEE
ncbi:carboxypeptidase-like regulatory domain-containing protein [Hydrocoleum sp. CS-953]|uniref:carboxypeptidase-like regulatory domain-containing protein n=1 Tax=Microcoleaceae TaxID=1892252 RepID=UPI000B9B468C|nr:carboxypeptidase-like regulatory domain-containing protein [Hydrocoleum sp. CS-953]OZH54636.1 hypothetical protein AFK68_09655 [Hydrocoleum sp. CS-953]